jgi:dTDP-4-amino-4,6-dideoxygalactose transaminase
MSQQISRRSFMTTAATGAAATAATFRAAPARGGAAGPTVVGTEAQKPAHLGGSPVRTARFPDWPVIDAREDEALLDVLHGKKWYRGDGKTVNRFEKAYAELNGARYCVATANGTSALFTSLAALDVGPGDEVILPPYTFVATLNVIFLQYALPVFVDSDIETSQIDATKVEAAVTDRTTALMPVHLGGNPADLDAIMDLSRRRKIPVVEDACQAVLGEWRGRKLGTVGATGCFSFQASKNLNSGEGGAILTDDEELADRCYSFHNHSRPRRRGGFDYGSSRAANLRITEFQAGLLLAQMTRLEDQAKTRDRNAQHLTRQIEEIPGIRPARMYDGCTRNAFHIYMLRYDPEEFAGLPRAAFIRALWAEGIPCAGGYRPLNKEALIRTTLESKAYKRIFPPEVLASWEERNRCPANDRLCEEAVWFGQTMLLGPQADMDDIATAMRKIHAAASDLAQA